MTPIWFGILRHALTAIGGGLVTGGYLSDGDIQAAIGAVLTLIGIAASVLNKRPLYDE